MDQDSYNRLREMVIKQLYKYNVNACDRDDFVSEVYLYILNRKGIVDVNDIYIYGDIANGILNYLKKEVKHRHYGINEHVLKDMVSSDSGAISLMELEELALEFEYGYLFIDHYIYDIAVEDLADKYNISQNKIYYEINKIKGGLNWVN